MSGHSPDVANPFRDVPWETTSLGCQGCVELKRCGGLRTPGGFLNGCRDFCICVDPGRCQWVCPKHPRRYWLRKVEVGGFELDGVPYAPNVEVGAVPSFVSLLQPRVLGTSLTKLEVAALPFSAAFKEVNGEARARSRRGLANSCNVSATRWILSGVEQDASVERWWRLKGRVEALKVARDAGVVLASTPNFSCMMDVPRPDNLHAIKRIAICWEEIQSAGIAGAFHLNGRNDRDFEETTRFISDHKEIEFVAFEFLTGASRENAAQIYLKRLHDLATGVGRPLRLLVRGGGFRCLKALEQDFAQVIYLSTEAFSKTHSRRIGSVMPNGRIHWSKNPTGPGASLTHLLANNLRAVAAGHNLRRARGDLFLFSGDPAKRADWNARRDDESLQRDLLLEIEKPS